MNSLKNLFEFELIIVIGLKLFIVIGFFQNLELCALTKISNFRNPSQKTSLVLVFISHRRFTFLIIVSLLVSLLLYIFYRQKIRGAFDQDVDLTDATGSNPQVGLLLLPVPIHPVTVGRLLLPGPIHPVTVGRLLLPGPIHPVTVGRLLLPGPIHPVTVG